MVQILVTQLGSTTSARKKHYTLAMLPNGDVYVTYGAREFNYNGSITIPLGSVTHHAAADFDKGVTKYRTLFTSKLANHDYDELIVDHKIVDVPFDVSRPGFNKNELIKAVFSATPEVLRIQKNSSNPKPVNIYSSQHSRQVETFRRTVSQPGTGNVGVAAPKQPVKTPAPVKVDTYFTKVEPKVVRPNGEVYYPREIMGHTDVALLREFRSKGIYVRLAGSPGSGKTALAEAAFPDLITMNGHGDMTVAHFVGTQLPQLNGGWKWQDGPLVTAMKEGRPLFVDEGTRIPTEVLNILFSVMDGRNMLRVDDNPSMPVVQGAKGFYVIMGYNPETLGARALDEALVSRFRIQIDVETDYDTAKILKVPMLPIKIAKNLRTRDIEDKKREGVGVWVPQMRELITYRDLIQMKAGEDFALATLLASCPRASDIPIVKSVIKDATKKDINVPSLGRIV